MSSGSHEADGDDEGAGPTKGLVSVRVVNGTAELLKPPAMPDALPGRRDLAAAIPGLFREGRERGLPQDWIVGFGTRT